MSFKVRCPSWNTQLTQRIQLCSVSMFGLAHRLRRESLAISLSSTCLTHQRRLATASCTWCCTYLIAHSGAAQSGFSCCIINRCARLERTHGAPRPEAKINKCTRSKIFIGKKYVHYHRTTVSLDPGMARERWVGVPYHMGQ